MTGWKGVRVGHLPKSKVPKYCRGNSLLHGAGKHVIELAPEVGSLETGLGTGVLHEQMKANLIRRDFLRGEILPGIDGIGMSGSYKSLNWI